MTAAKTRKPAAKKDNGAAPAEQSALAAAIAHEEKILQQAEAIWSKDEWADSADLNPWIFRELRPLLRKPIPSGFIEHVGKVEGKPYDSVGVKSVQVQMDRLDNVLGPKNWGYEATYSDDGKRCHVRVWVGTKADPLFERDSWGGMNRGSTEGNLWKGSFTNAAKLALARLGPGWEVYVGAADFDPDTDEDAAKAQEAKSDSQNEERRLPKDAADRLLEQIKKAGLEDTLTAKLRGFGVKALTDLTVEQSIKVYEWCGGEVQPKLEEPSDAA